jgi:hypothetical protein
MDSNSNILIFSICLIIFATLFINRKETYADPKILEIRNNLMKIDPSVTSKLNIQASNQSFTEDKRDMYLCLKDKKTGQYYPDNMLNYVAIHELAHAKSKAVDTAHSGTEFRENFENYLQIAQKLGIFDPKKGLVDEYCGVTPDMK